MFMVILTGSPFYKSNHYLVVTPGALVAQRSKKRATKMTQEQAEKVAAKWGGLNQWTASVVAA